MESGVQNLNHALLSQKIMNFDLFHLSHYIYSGLSFIFNLTSEVITFKMYDFGFLRLSF